MRRRRRYLECAIAGVVLVAGCLGSPPSADPSPTSSTAIQESRAQGGAKDALQAAVQGWNFTGMSGSLAFDADNLSWIEIAFPAPVHPYEVQLEVVTVYGDTFWEVGTAGSIGWRSEEGVNDSQEVTLPPLVSDSPDRSSVGVSAAASGAAGSHEVPLDGPTQDAMRVAGRAFGVVAEDTAKMTTFYSTTKSDYKDGDEFRRPVEHFFSLDMTPITPEKPVTVSIQWESTVVAVSWGTREDTFAFSRDDFSTDDLAAVQHGIHQSYATGTASLAAGLVTDDRPVVYFFSPRACDGNCRLVEAASGTVTRPDGGQEQGPVVGGATTMAGEWMFQIPEHRQAADSQAPVFFAARALPATLPWADGSRVGS